MPKLAAVGRTRRRLILVAVGVVAPLLLVEVALHVIDPLHFGLVRERDALGPAIFEPGTLELRPGARARYLGHEVAIGTQGMRTPEFSVAKPPGVYRVLVLGDSVAFGWGIAEEDTVARVLERALNDGRVPRGHQRVEVINAAVPGWGIDHQYLMLRDRGIALDPDLVVLVFIANDLQLPLTRRSRRPARFVPDWLRRLYTLCLLERMTNQLLPGPVHEDFTVQLPTDDAELIAQAQRGVCRFLAEIVKICGEVPFVLLDTVGSRGEQPLPILAECARGLGIHHVPAFFAPPDLRDYAREFAVSPADPHPNARAHRMLADRVLEWIGRNPPR